jgi:hypothetical protein
MEDRNRNEERYDDRSRSDRGEQSRSDRSASDRSSSDRSSSDRSRSDRSSGESDQRGRGGYGDSSGFSGAGTRASSDDDMSLPQHQELQNRPDVGMRGRSTGRSRDEESR